jgi:Domain of unknown function (DUF4397)
MKNIYKTLNRLIFASMMFLLLSSCEKDHNFTPYQETIPESSAKVKFIHTAVGPLGVNFRVNYAVNDQKISAISVTSGLPTGLTYNSQYPLPINYAFVPSGNQSLKVVIPATTTVPESQVSTGSLVSEAGKNYSCFLTGTSPNYSVFQVNDDFSVIEADKSKAYIRFLNLITNTPAAGYDIALIKTTPATSTTPEIKTVVKTFSGVIYKGAGEVFVPIDVIPETENTPYEIQLRAAGVTTTFIARLLTGFIPRAGRVYTLYSVGIAGGLPNATTNVPTVTFYTNR